jgi:Uma2 family endonuclease
LDSVVNALVFPESADVPESLLHLDLRTLLYQLLKDYLGSEATVGSDQFIYYDAADPKRVLAPDVYVQLSSQSTPIRSWKVWERGAPEVAVEIVSESDASQSAWLAKLEQYRSLGVRELIRFDPEGTSPAAIRIWHRVNDDLLERHVEALPCASLVLNLHWVVAPGEGYPNTLRIASGSDGGALILTRAESRNAEALRAQLAADRAQLAAARADAEAAARQAAETRIRELEALLAKQPRE